MKVFLFNFWFAKYGKHTFWRAYHCGCTSRFLVLFILLVFMNTVVLAHCLSSSQNSVAITLSAVFQISNVLF